jgi:hypothetical protein
MNISLPDSLKKFVEERVGEDCRWYGEQASEPIRRDEREVSASRLRGLAHEGLAAVMGRGVVSIETDMLARDGRRPGR